MNNTILKKALLGLFAFAGVQAFGQQIHSITNIPDTSFSFYSAYKSVKKSNPEAAIHQLSLGDSVNAIHNVTYCTVNGRQLQLDVFSPKYYKGKLPAVLMIFGGGWRSGNRSMHVPMAMSLAAKGYIVATADYRLSTEALYPAAVNDLKTAIKWLRVNAKKYHIDQSKIATWGFSAGGQLAVLVGTTGGSPLFPGNGVYDKYSDKVQAIVDVDGTLAFIHPESGEGDDSKKVSAATYWFGFTKNQRPDLWQQAAGLNHVDKNTPPTLFLNSGVARMHAGRDDYNHKLDSLHIYHEVHTFAGAPHPFILFDPWFTPALNYTVTFLDKVFKNKP
ncbi:alpha/beta hydrolase [Mucilaginibacter boryungensis]|uniref:Alpha/beta hydrolase n=1 Tax=Mucilaginibacter boryungensis TaxID=768480 RepID=A0ABR9XJ17_9SPHI|nr:alpha/beta hydrolase [Mucilaginibacter boryungensis]MBE9667368.1 alpha/beta hydrolase [Mucilaginibacter boryungensis]